MFLVWQGRMTIEFRDQTVESRGRGVVRGASRRRAPDNGRERYLGAAFQTGRTRDTGNISDAKFTAPFGDRI